MNNSIIFLSEKDIIYPTDFCRPLIRSADYSYYDEWMEESCYGGNPLDHLKWCPVWLHLGDFWWGKKYKEYFEFSSIGKYTEFVRGTIPETHKLKDKKYYKRHPLWYESYLEKKEIFENYTFKVGKFKNKTVKFLLKNYFPHRELIEYFQWYFKEVEPSKKEILEDFFEEEKYKIYYQPKFKKFLKK